MNRRVATAATPLRRALAIFLVMSGLAWLLAGTALGSTPRVRLIEVDGAITPVMANYVHRGIREAERAGDHAVVIRLNTPGGLSSAMDDIIQDILASEVPVIVYVAPSGARAASAGVYITYAAHVAAMAPATNIGSASPVLLGQDGQPAQTDETMQQKVVNDAVAKIRGLAELRGRNADWAEQAVREAVNITADQALQMGVIDVVAPSLDALLDTVDGRPVTTMAGEVTLQTRDAEIVPVDMNLVEQFFQILSDPNVAYILLSLGLLGIFLELANPGAVLPGVVGGIFLLLGLFALGNLDVNWAGVLLMAFGFILFIADLYLPTHGVLTVGGIISFALGSFLLMQSPISPVFQISRAVILTVTALVAISFLAVITLVARAHARRPATGREGLIGTVGVVRRALDPEGMVFVEGELWRARSNAGRISEGQLVRVVGVEGLRLTVAPVAPEEVETVAEQPQPAGGVLRPLASITRRGNPAQ
ncbi:nodulation protein NfeD [Thermomicrobiaceae bacterium CFH 74404]|uniref:Nodulation protein NfeD n=1 Tax=Thermalbibacter longus TaxID=2951981 RepID=A0AA41WFV8_9BACT|nr:nodulation protein NfeD [Thermalbibacter longus]MCM8748656.1 nodulation protein NfeD [Thermalbibacter longus]